MDVDESDAKPHVSALPASSADFQYTCHIVRPHRRQEARASRASEVADRLIKGVLTSILSLDRAISREQIRAKLPSILPDVAARTVTGPLGALVVEHEATTSRIGEDQIFYCLQRGLTEEQAIGLIVNGYAKEVLNKLPMEFAVEARKLLTISLEGSVG